MSIKRIRELREARRKNGESIQSMLKKCETEKREFNSEERVEFDKLITATEEMRGDVERLERALELDKELQVIPSASDPEARQGDAAEAEQRNAWRSYIVNGRLAAQEARALQVSTDNLGGYLKAPQVLVNELLKFVDNAVILRAKATKYRVNSNAGLGVPSLETDVDDANWTTEFGTGSLDTAMRFGKRELKPHPFAKRIKVSKSFLRQVTAINGEGLVMQRLGYKMGITEEKGFMTGSGANQPLGLFTASASGIPTSRDISTGNTTTAPTFDGLREVKYGLKTAYHNMAEWLFHRDCIKILSKIKDGNGQYIWEQNVKVGEPDMLLGRPLNLSEYVPNTFTTGLYVGLFGVFSYYWIADLLDIQFQRLDELYAETDEVGYIVRAEADGMPVMPEAWARVKLA